MVPLAGLTMLAGMEKPAFGCIGADGHVHEEGFVGKKTVVSGEARRGGTEACIRAC